VTELIAHEPPGGDGERPAVLVVDDEPAIIRLITLEMASQGFEVTGCAIGDATFRAIEELQPAAVLMEVMLPGLSGVKVLREIKERYDVPVILLTTASNEADRAYGLEMGADDYITKPFSPEELALRINALLNRAPHEGKGAQVLRAGHLSIDLGHKIVRRDGDVVALGTNEWALILALSATPNEPVAAPDLLVRVWSEDHAAERKYLEAWIARLRRKVERDPSSPQVLVGDADAGYELRREG
jgi:two-component system, OmpR family, response regulator MtrA